MSENASGEIVCLKREQIGQFKALFDNGQFFWLDLIDPTDAELAGVDDALSLHPLAIEDSSHFDQRPKLEDYGSFTFIVFYGAAPLSDDDRLVEVHLFYSERFLVTVRRDQSDDLDLLQDRAVSLELNGARLLHAVLDALADSFRPRLDELDSELEAVEERVFSKKLDGCDTAIYKIRRGLSRLSRLLHQQRDMVIRASYEGAALPGVDDEVRPYFRDLSDHLVRMSELADSYRDRTGGVTEIFLAASSNKLNVVMKQFTVIAGIFLPLTWLVGFFGQNYKWMTDHIGSEAWFIWTGLVLPAVIVAAMVVFIVRRGWLRE